MITFFFLSDGYALQAIMEITNNFTNSEQRAIVMRYQIEQQSAVRKSPRKYVSYFVFMSDVGLEHWLHV